MKDFNVENLNVYQFIDYIIGDLLLRETNFKTKKIEVRKVIDILLKIENLMPEMPMDGDEYVKRLNKKDPE